MNQRTFTIALRGFEDRDVNVLKRICTLSAGRSRNYQLATDGQFDILAADARHVPDLPESNDHPVLWVCSQPCPQRKFQVRRPLLAPRVMKMLDQVTIEALHFLPEVSVGDQAVPRAPTAQSTVDSMVESNGAPGNAMRVLVADDSELVRTQIGIILDLLGIAGDFVADGREALSRLQSQQYDLVLMDVVMPNLDGLEATKLIKKRSKGGRKLPVVLLTGKKSPIDRLKGAFAGCDTYLTKPVQQPELVDVLKQYLDLTPRDLAGVPMASGYA